MLCSNAIFTGSDVHLAAAFPSRCVQVLLASRQAPHLPPAQRVLLLYMCRWGPLQGPRTLPRRCSVYMSSPSAIVSDPENGVEMVYAQVPLHTLPKEVQDQATEAWLANSFSASSAGQAPTQPAPPPPSPPQAPQSWPPPPEQLQRNHRQDQVGHRPRGGAAAGLCRRTGE